ncbi:MAG: hypothetical protein IJM21_10215 [Clostridia bacterium]|nr:hypothetical protein [Clostridia bacterium]
MPCNQTCNSSCTWIIILAFIIIWFSCGNRSLCGGNGGCGGSCGCNNGCGGF